MGKQDTLNRWKSDLEAKEREKTLLASSTTKDMTCEIQTIDNEIDMLENIISDMEFEINSISYGSQSWDY